MDNSYILLLILKKEINVSNFLQWYRYFTDCVGTPKWDDYLKFTYKCSDLGSINFSEFEFNYFVSYLRLRGIINE